jgi:hypothetical protein
VRDYVKWLGVLEEDIKTSMTYCIQVFSLANQILMNQIILEGHCQGMLMEILFPFT